MKTIVITIHVVIALIAAQLPSHAEPLVNRSHTANSSIGMIRKGQPLSAVEIVDLEAKSTLTHASVSREAGGAEATSGVLVLAVIGALVVVGAVIYAANRNSEKRE
jgi:hypothetical protein